MTHGIFTNTYISAEEKIKINRSDRRRCPTPIISRYTLYGGQRKTARRAEDKIEHIFVDLYSSRLLAIVMSLLVLSCLDAYLTLSLIGTGRVIEANPVMAFFLDYGFVPFTLIKFIITSTCIIILCVLKNVKITRICLPCAINVYVFVVVYELYLFMI